MSILMTVLMVVQVLSALGVIVLVLLQHGKGADMGAAFGSGASGSLFGASGSANFMSRTTGGLATIFFCATLGIAMMSDRRVAATGSVMEGAAATIPGSVPGSVPVSPPASGPGSPAGGSGAPAGVPPASVPASGGASTSGAGAIPGPATAPSQR
ncbi:MAG: preprotein translocase subunit SecG [Betaproteobacteria bacterium]|jgi:preprotein translocase subunit SecG|nr:preprotein translocase subunit SecG [Betaproteobacteria bacterium]